MTLNEFITKYDREGAVVLLEGKRNVAENDIHRLKELGKLLAGKTQFMKFRSGNASGSDEYFSMGVASVNPQRLQVITPYKGHRKTKTQTDDIIALDELDMKNETELIKQSCYNKKMVSQINEYVAGNIHRNSIKAAYIIRDTLKVIGSNNTSPATFGIFYDDLAKPRHSGTGHTIKICEANNIPAINQTIWLNWLEK